MPVVPFSTLPESARIWVFSSARALTEDEAQRLLGAVDHWLAGWRAHGAPLTASRDWRDDRFLAVAVDTSDVAASGCSIDALFGVLRQLERELDTSLVGSGRVYWRDSRGAIQSAARADLERVMAEGAITGDTLVFDPTVPSVGAWRERFELPARDSWHAVLLPVAR